jgi:hypothetical protein
VESSSLGWKVPVLGGKFQAMLLDKNPGRFRCRQVVVLRHAAPGPECSEIIFAVYIQSSRWVENTLNYSVLRDLISNFEHTYSLHVSDVN